MSTYTNLDIQLAADAVVPALLKKVDAFNAFTTNYSKSGAKKGDNILVQVESAGAALDFDGSYCGNGSDSTVGVDITLNKHIISRANIPGYLANTVNLQEKVKGVVSKVVEAAQVYVYDQITDVNFTSNYAAGAATAFDLAKYLALDIAASDANLSADRTVVISDTAMASLQLSTAGLFNTTGLMSNPTIASNLIKSSTGLDGYGFITDKSAIGIAFAFPDATFAKDSGMTVTQVALGDMNVQLRMIYDECADTLTIIGEILMGVSVMKAGALVRVTVA